MKLHWYLFSVVGISGAKGNGSATVGIKNSCVTQSVIESVLEEFSKGWGVNKDNLVVTSVSYLGHMTEEEFNE